MIEGLAIEVLKFFFKFEGDLAWCRRLRPEIDLKGFPVTLISQAWRDRLDFKAILGGFFDTPALDFSIGLNQQGLFERRH